MIRLIRYSLLPLATLPLLSLPAVALATAPPATGGNSTVVHISATVVDNTCEVDSTTPWNLGSIKVSDIMNGTQGAEKAEHIMLKNCGTDVTGITVSTVDSGVDAQGQIKNQLVGKGEQTPANNVVAEILSGNDATTANALLTAQTPVKFTQRGSKPLDFMVKLLPSGGKPTAGTYNANIALKLAYE